MTKDKDYYKILGVDEKATGADIKKAYRKLAKRHHPDANQGNPSAAERFKDIGEAHSVLSDPAKRKNYDRMRKLGAMGDISTGPWSGASASGGFSFEDLGGLGGLSDMFSSLFDRSRGGPARQSAGPRKGQDVEYAIEVPFLTAVRGGKVTIRVPISEGCATCSESGGAPGTSWKECAECGGSGSVSFGQGGFAVTRPCPACVGRGKAPQKECDSCGGSGKVHQRRKFQVSIPAGSETGSKVRIPGQGEGGRDGGGPGHLIITFKVKPHGFFRQKGSDILVSVPINIAQAVLGSRVRVNTIWGNKVVLRIPPGTQPGTRFRIRGQGIRRKGRTGNQYVEVKVQIPETLTEEQQGHLRAFADAADLRH